MRRIVGLVGFLAACDPGTGGGGELESCDLAADSQTCPACVDGLVTCTFGEVSATEGSCGDCQARAALYQALCDAGETASADEIEADTVCSDPVLDTESN